ncbi:MAG: hypothetical protein ACYDA5_02190 [Vulcanimicrobiaceae bacterium]
MNPTDVILLRETEARRALHGVELRVRVLAPVGPWLGSGALRVLRASYRDAAQKAVDLIVGYESYERQAG